MSQYVLQNSQILLGASEISAVTGEFLVSQEAAMKPAQNLAALGYNVVLPGVFTATGDVKGHADFSTAAATWNASKVGSQQAFGVIIDGTAAVAGGSAQFMRGRLDKITTFMGSVGDVADFEVSISGDAAEIDGFVLAPYATRTSAGLAGTAIQVGAVPAGKSLYIGQFCGATSAGVNLISTVTSDNAVGFPSPAAVATLPTLSAPGWSWTVVAGPNTDDWFKVASTIASGTFSYAVLIGIG